MESYWGGGDAASADSGHRCECGGAFGAPEADGFSYCPTCGSQSQDVFHAVADEDDLHAAAGEAALYSIRLKRKCSQSQPDTTTVKLEQTQTDSVSEPEVRDFGGAVNHVGKDELVDGIRRRYVEGLQVMLQRQCEALVERFGASPIIAGFVGTIWLRFVDASGVFDDGWPERVVAESEAAFAAALDDPDYSKDLSSYLKYCKEIVFAGRIHSPEEDKLMERLRNISEKQEFQGNTKNEDSDKFDMKQEILTDELYTSSSLDTKELKGGSQDNRHMDDKKIPMGNGFVSKTDYPDREVAIQNMKLNMEENGFQYLSPRSRPKNTGYLHYRRKRADGELNFVAHADYYILLRTCARLAQVDVRVMHLGILKLERRLEWTDQQIDISLH